MKRLLLSKVAMAPCGHGHKPPLFAGKTINPFSRKGCTDDYFQAGAFIEGACLNPFWDFFVIVAMKVIRLARAGDFRDALAENPTLDSRSGAIYNG